MYDRFEPFSKSFVRDIVDDDLQRLTQIANDSYYTFLTRIKQMYISKLEEEMKRGRV
jgi:topoisomerase-4 subunit A